MLSAEEAAKLNTARNNQTNTMAQLRALALEKERALAVFDHEEALLAGQLESHRAEIAGILGRTATTRDSRSSDDNILHLRPQPAPEPLPVSLAVAR